MKTTTKIIAAKKLAKSSISKTTIAYQVVAELLEIQGAKKTYKIYNNTIRPVHTSGSGRFTSNQDHTQSIIDLLKEVGIECLLSNDSKRGGLTGNLLTITTKLK